MTETNILLPTASVHFFLKDAETTDAARSLVNDWRYARVNVSVEEGDVNTAVQSYQETTSPDLIIIETEKTDDSFVDELAELSAYCEENTNAIVIGPVNDVDLYRNLKQMGVSDYLVRPVPVDMLSEIVASALIEQLGTSGSRLIAVMGAKGGVGASALTQGLAWGLSENLGHKTFLMDASGGWSSLSVGMGFDPAGTLHEAVKAASTQDIESLERMYHKVNDKLTVLATGADAMLEASVHAQQYEDLIDFIMQSHPVLLVDLSDAIPSLKRTVLNKAHEILLVTTPTLPSLRASKTLMNEIKLLQGGNTDHIDLVVNMSGMIPGKEVPAKDIEVVLDEKPSVVIPFDAKAFVGTENEGRKLTQDKTGSSIVYSLLPVAERVLNPSGVTIQQPEQKGLLDTVMSIVKKD
ncbi:MAG: P-loop NTPase [Pseudomonadota bacterium]